MIRAGVFALICGVSLLGEGPPPEKYHLVKVDKIYADPPRLYVYVLSGGKQCTLDTRLYIKEGSEIKTALEGDDVYLMDIDGLVYKCGLRPSADNVELGKQPKK